ncbi:MAG: TetR/AcrR family transcriptional regulator [Acidimicrobiia bacterium]|nr:TetR/AcrR family transcriptional regulator [Acidimicrobiia bacterium]
MTETRQILLRRARELFNEHGLQAIGVRDLARDLDLSPGNVSYYFARKENLVEALMEELRTKNQQNLQDLLRATSLADLLSRYRTVFSTQYEYRFLARAVVEIVETYPRLGDLYSTVDRERTRGLAEAFKRMVGTDLESGTSDTAISAIVGTCTLTARFWLSEMRLSFDEIDPEIVIDHYLALIAHTLWAAATPPARRSLQAYLDRIIPTGLR